MIPFRTTAPGYGAATVSLSLITANIVIYVIQMGLSPADAKAFTYTYALVPGFLSHPDVALEAGLQSFNFLPLISNTFMHGGWMHLIVNMWTLWLFAVPLEDRLGPWRFLLLYLGAGLAGSIGHLIFNLDSLVPALGASGAVAGILGAFAVTYPREKVLVVQPIFIFPLVFPLPALFYTLIWFGLQFVQGVTDIGNKGGGIAWWAHIGGFVAGIGLVLLLQRKRPGHPTAKGPWG